jgi:hypothetical protein
LARSGCCISPRYGPFLLGGRFETYELFICSILKSISGRVELRITEIANTESVDTGARLYLFTYRLRVAALEEVPGLTNVTSDWTKISRRVTVSGTAFTDRWMGQRGVGETVVF